MKGEQAVPDAPIDRILAGLRAEMVLDVETEQEVMAELRDHLEEAFADARSRGLDVGEAWGEVATRFGVGDEVGRALQAAHAGWGTADAVIAAALPVGCALVLRWLAFAPDGTALGWPQLLSRPAFWVVALVALLLPMLQFERWRYALATWAFFWVLTVLFVALPALRW
jgi:hypothetical protein